MKHNRLLALVTIIAAVEMGACGSSPSTRVRSERLYGRTTLSLEKNRSFYETPHLIEQLRVVPVPDSSTLLILWNELTAEGHTSHSAISLDGTTVAVTKKIDPRLRLRYRDFDPLLETPLPPSGSSPSNTNLYVVQFETQPLALFLDQLKRTGAKPYRYIPNNAYLVFMSAEVRRVVAVLPYVRWVGPYEWFYRVEPYLEGGSAPARFNIEVFERGMAQQNAVGQVVESLGGRVEQTTPDGLFLQATLVPSGIPALASLDEVVFIDQWSPPESDMDLVRDIGGADFLEQVAGLTGEGVRGEVLDVGVRATHRDFDGTLLTHGTQNVASHGTSTTGIIFGKGIVESRARGMLPNGQGITAWHLGLTNRYQHTAELLAAPYFAVFQSNSWGGGLTTQYTTASAQMDDILFRTDLLVTQSQSNSGTRDSRPEAWAKNIVSVGGLNHYRSLDMETHCWCRHASIGPAADGRIKPDLAHFYDEIYTTTGGGDSAYTPNFSGTSASTPIVAGHFGLFFQMWHLGFFGNRIAKTVFDSRPHMTTSKAVMINTARQWSFSGTTHDRTRTHQGWGIPDLRNLYDLRGRLFIVDETDVLQPLERKTYALSVLEGTPELKATLVYKDPSGLPSATIHRINDLSLHVLSPSGVEYWGNNGLLVDRWSASGGEEDHLNTVENVFVLTPEPGNWTVEVIASEVNEDSHLQTPELDADFALVVSGVSRP